jgi:hypothetical protein
MADVSVSAQNTRIHDMESVDVGQTITSMGGGAGAGLEGTFFYQNANCIARKITSSTGAGFYSTTTSTHDISTGSGTYQTIMYKTAVTTSPDLQNIGATNPGQQMRIGSDDSNYYEYDVEGADTYPPKALWRITPIDPNIVGYRDATTGSPSLTAADYWGIEAAFVAGGAKDLNVGVDAIDVGNGLTLVGGDGGEADGVFQNFVNFDEGTITNRYGYVTTNNIGLEVFGTLVIGSATPTVFQDSGVIVAFPDGRFLAGWSGITVGLANVTNDIGFTGCSFFGKGSVGTTDTRPVLTVTGTSGAFGATDCVFDTFASLTLTSAATITGGTISNSGQITQSSATIDSCTISNGTGSASILSNNPSNLDACIFTSDGSNHAIEINTTGPFDLTNHTFTSYATSDGSTGNEVIYNNSGGTVTLNASGNTGTISVRNAASCTTNIVTSVNVNVHVEDTSGTAIEYAQVYIQKSATGKQWNYLTETTGDTVSQAGDSTLVVTGSVDADLPQGGWVHVWDSDTNTKQNYRYQSWSTSADTTFTLRDEDTGNATSAGTSTELNSASISSLDINEGDTIRNTTDTGAWAVVDEITADQAITTPLQGGTNNEWQDSDGFSVHKLAINYEDGVDKVDIPLFNGQTEEASGDISTTYNWGAIGATLPIRVRIRSNQGSPKYIPYNTSGSITGDGYSTTVVLSEDDVAA